MGSKIDAYRQILCTLDDWEPYLREHSGLPGPRGNLELVQAAAEEGDEAHFWRWLAVDAVQAPANSAGELLPVCGAVGLGRLLAEGRTDLLPVLRHHASDVRWRLREGVAMALQRLGDRNMDALLAEMEVWGHGSRLEQRAAAAAVCEPRLLGRPEHARRVLHLLDGITASVAGAPDRRSTEFRVLRQALGYCWSVAVAALPDEGRQAMEKWLADPDPDVAWIMRENLGKQRLVRLDPAWVARWVAACQAGGGSSI